MRAWRAVVTDGHSRAEISDEGGTERGGQVKLAHFHFKFPIELATIHVRRATAGLPWD